MAEEEISIFSWYTMVERPPKGDWNYKIKDFPKGWKWIAGCYCASYTKYDREDQFHGPLKSEHEMVYALEQFYEHLRQAGVITIYRVGRET
jgi:hypothetical protein